jgi:hypothetical protein
MKNVSQMQTSALPSSHPAQAGLDAQHNLKKISRRIQVRILAVHYRVETPDKPMRQRNLSLPSNTSPDDVEAIFHDVLKPETSTGLWLAGGNEAEMACTHSAGARLMGVTAACGLCRAMFSSAAIHTQPVGGRRLDWLGTRARSMVECAEVRMARGWHHACVLASTGVLKSLRGWCRMVRCASPGLDERSALRPASLLFHAGWAQS